MKIHAKFSNKTANHFNQKLRVDSLEGKFGQDIREIYNIPGYDLLDLEIITLPSLGGDSGGSRPASSPVRS